MANSSSTYLSLGALLDVAERGGVHSTSSRDKASEWNGGISWGATAKMARGAGYREAIPEAERAAERAAAASLIGLRETFETRFDVAGSGVDIARFLSGEPECMIEGAPIVIPTAGRATRLLVAAACSNTIPADVILRRGAAVVALSIACHSRQTPLEIWLSVDIRGKKNIHRDYVRLQAADEALDIGRIMFGAAHPAFLRRIMFSSWETWNTKKRVEYGISPGGSYGRVIDADPSGLPPMAGNTFSIPRVNPGDTWSAEYVASWLEEHLALLAE